MPDKIVLLTKKKIEFNSIIQLFKTLEIYVLGQWNKDITKELPLDSKYLSHSYLKLASSPNGLALVLSYQNRRFFSSWFYDITFGVLELHIYLDSFDHLLREKLVETVIKYHQEHTLLFDLVLRDRNDDGNEIDWNQLYDDLQSIEYL